MSEGYRTRCVDETWRLTNDEFGALMAEVARRSKGSSQRLFLAIAPLLIAFYEGQVQAGRVDPQDLEYLVQQALLAAHRCRAGYDPSQPFRAWLLDVARSRMDDYCRDHRGSLTVERKADIHLVRKTGLGTPESEVERLLGTSPREPDHVIRDAQLAWLAHA